MTITGPTPAGPTTYTDTLPIIDLAHKRGVLEICGRCSLRFVYVNIAHENVVGTGLGMTAVRGLPGSRLERLGGVGLRVACPATQPTLKILNSTQRTQLFPNADGRQLAGATDYVFRVRCSAAAVAKQRARTVVAVSSSSSVAKQQVSCCTVVAHQLPDAAAALAHQLTQPALALLSHVQGKPYHNMLQITDLSSDIPLQLLANDIYTGGYAIVSCVDRQEQCSHQAHPASFVAICKQGGGSEVLHHACHENCQQQHVIGTCLWLLECPAAAVQSQRSSTRACLHRNSLLPVLCDLLCSAAGMPLVCATT